MIRFLTSLMVGAFFMFGAVSTHAQDFDRGSAAYQTGDFATAMKEWRPLAEQGDAVAQYNLGTMYDNGDGVVQDYAEAVKLYRLAAEQGDAYAQNNLGVAYGYGQGVLQDNILSHMWYNIASANGYKKSSEWRDEIAAKMTAADISKAQAMAKECMSSGYKNCGW